MELRLHFGGDVAWYTLVPRRRRGRSDDEDCGGVGFANPPGPSGYGSPFGTSRGDVASEANSRNSIQIRVGEGSIHVRRLALAHACLRSKQALVHRAAFATSDFCVRGLDLPPTTRMRRFNA